MLMSIHIMASHNRKVKKRNVRQTNKQDAGMSHDDSSLIYKLGKRKWSQLIVFVPFHRIYQGQ